MRRRLIETGAVDAIVGVGPNMFYTVTLPVTLWFLDRGKARGARADQVLFIDARHLFRQVTRAHRVFDPDMVEFLANIVRLWRGQAVEKWPAARRAWRRRSRTGRMRRARPVPGGEAGGNRGAGLEPEPWPLCGGGARAGGGRRGVQSGAGAVAGGAGRAECRGGAVAGTDRAERGGAAGGMTRFGNQSPWASSFTPNVVSHRRGSPEMLRPRRSYRWVSDVRTAGLTTSTPLRIRNVDRSFIQRGLG